jgi:ABC-type Mn2+/Zn2+ transport system permease subunit
MQTVGVGLVAAMLVTPGATAYLLTRRLSRMLFISALIGGLASITGLYLSFYLNIASGAAIVLCATLMFIVAYVFAPEKGIIHIRKQQSME